MIECSSKSSFDGELKKAKSLLVVVDCHAIWCGPCKTIAPFFQKLSEKHAKEAVFLKVDIDKNQEVAREIGVKAVPTFAFFHECKKVDVLEGADPGRLEETVRRLISTHSRKAFQSAGHRLTDSTPVKAAQSAQTGQTGQTAPVRKNPWADPNFVPPGMRRSLEAKSVKDAQVSLPTKVSQPIQPPEPGTFDKLLTMGFSQEVAKGAISAVGDDFETALSWCLNRPETVATESVDESEDAPLDDQMAEIVAAIKVDEDKQSSGGNSSAPSKKVSDMSSEEKMAWLAERRAMVKNRRAEDELRGQKDAYKNQVSTSKAISAANELQEKLAADQAAAAQKKKKKEQDESKKHRKEIKEKIDMERERRRLAHQHEMDKLQKK